MSLNPARGTTDLGAEDLALVVTSATSLPLKYVVCAAGGRHSVLLRNDGKVGPVAMVRSAKSDRSSIRRVKSKYITSNEWKLNVCMCMCVFLQGATAYLRECMALYEYVNIDPCHRPLPSAGTSMVNVICPATAATERLLAARTTPCCWPRMVWFGRLAKISMDSARRERWRVGPLGEPIKI